MTTESLKADPLRGTAYTSEKLLGSGAMGEAYVARHGTLDHRCVVKIMREHMVDDPRGFERMRLEAQALGHVNHPNVVRILDFDRTPSGRLFYVMEYLEGEPLNQEAYDRVALPWREAVDIVCQVLAGLAEVHHNGIVHRDAPHASRSASPRETRSRSCLGRRMTDTAQGRRHGASSDCPAMARGATVLAPHGASGVAGPPPPPGRPPPVVAPSP